MEKQNKFKNMIFLFNFNSSFPEWDECEIYHDENKDNRIIHGFLLVPKRVKPKILAEIQKIRTKYNCDSKLHYNDLTGKNENIKHKTVRDIINIMTGALRRKNFIKGIWGDLPPRCKFIMFMKINPRKMRDSFFSSGENDSNKQIHIRKIATLFRIGLKGGLHYLFDEENKIKITGFFTDGNSWAEGFNKAEVLQRLYVEKKDYIDFDEKLLLEPILSNHKDERCLDYDRAQLLQVCDCLLGAFINSIFGGRVDSFKTKIAKPMYDILNKQKKRKGNFKYSGHYKSFAISKAFLENGQWFYRPLEPKELEKESNAQQLEMFESYENINLY